MQAQRYSAQREKIYQAVWESREHPTAEMVFSRLKPEMPRLSLGTVYRNLHQMAEEGRLQELPGHVARFDGNVRPHAHLQCEHCGGVSDVPVPYAAALDQAAESEGFRIRNHSLVFHGVCRGCMAGETKA